MSTDRVPLLRGYRAAFQPRIAPPAPLHINDRIALHTGEGVRIQGRPLEYLTLRAVVQALKLTTAEDVCRLIEWDAGRLPWHLNTSPEAGYIV